MLRLLSLCLVAVTTSCATAAWDSKSAPSAYDAAERGYRGDDDGRYAEETSVASEPAPGNAVADAMSSLFGSSEKASGGAPSPDAPPKLAPPIGPPEPNVDEPKPIEAAKRLVIYTGSMALMVPVTDVAIATFLEKVTAMGGFLQQRSSTTVTVRVPAAQFFPTIEMLRKSGTVTDEQVNAADVTKKVFDIELRLQTAEESRKRLLKILESATKIEDILAIEVQIRRLTEEIELMKGELRTLGDQIAFSTLTVNFFANAPAPRPYPDRTRSRFEWINQVGVEQVLYGF
ncbi:MAG: DUF4349 domain-containing protein [Deltaproteobacteria bacterium]|nr:DUF4349 domain-containing protein [Deltaproteobacteria bacterium]